MSITCDISPVWIERNIFSMEHFTAMIIFPVDQISGSPDSDPVCCFAANTMNGNNTLFLSMPKWNINDFFYYSQGWFCF
jgi:hypothetical protein